MKSKKKQIYVGMSRPKWEDTAYGGGYIQCTCGNVLQTVGMTREHWQMGHFDTPVYKEV